MLTETKPTRAEMLQVIGDFVEKERKRMNLQDYSGPKTEGSCIAEGAKGEFKNMLYRQLMHMNPFDWLNVLADREILEGVYDYVRREVEWKENPEGQHAAA